MIAEKVVAITGASSGIGEATALACAGEGAKVALAARRADRIEALAQRIRDEGGEAVAIETDVREEGAGHIVNVSSTAGRIASLGSAVYNLTKWGVVGFSEGLRQEALHANVRVTIIEPGYVETELQGHNVGNPIVMEAMEKMRQQIDPLAASDIADAI